MGSLSCRISAADQRVVSGRCSDVADVAVRYVPTSLGDKWAVRCVNTDELVRGWRKGQTKLIWRGSFEEATELSGQLSKTPPREELDKTQKIHYMNVARRKKATVKRSTVTPVFHRCEDCAKMVKEGHHC